MKDPDKKIESMVAKYLKDSKTPKTSARGIRALETTKNKRARMEREKVKPLDEFK